MVVNMRAVFKRELSSYFNSPIAYVFISAVFFFSGLYFWLTLQVQSSDLSYVTSMMFSFYLFLIPLLTMKLMSDDKRFKTDQLLYTAPMGLTPIIMGKFLAAMVVFAASISINIIYAIVMAFFATPAWILLISNLLGTLLLGAAIIALGLFVSSLTESQVVAAVSTFAVSLILFMIDTFKTQVKAKWLLEVIGWFSLGKRFNDFTIGVIDYANIIYFLSIAAFFIFLTVRLIERKRWS